MAFSFVYPPPPAVASAMRDKINRFQYEAVAVNVRMSERNPRWTGDMSKADDQAKKELNELSLAHLGYASPYYTQ
jgi:hypothetical protein